MRVEEPVRSPNEIRGAIICFPVEFESNLNFPVKRAPRQEICRQATQANSEVLMGIESYVFSLILCHMRDLCTVGSLLLDLADEPCIWCLFIVQIVRANVSFLHFAYASPSWCQRVSRKLRDEKSAYHLGACGLHLSGHPWQTYLCFKRKNVVSTNYCLNQVLPQRVSQQTDIPTSHNQKRVLYTAWIVDLRLHCVGSICVQTFCAPSRPFERLCFLSHE